MAKQIIVWYDQWQMIFPNEEIIALLALVYQTGAFHCTTIRALNQCCRGIDWDIYHIRCHQPPKIWIFDDCIVQEELVPREIIEKFFNGRHHWDVTE